MARVICLKCRTVRDLPLQHVLFSPVHCFLLHFLPCPHCERYTWHRHLLPDDEESGSVEEVQARN
jgi:hypothetical protein